MPKDKKVSMLKIMMIALAAVLLVLIPVRCYQYASGVIEPTTGFYSGSDWSISCLPCLPLRFLQLR